MNALTNERATTHAAQDTADLGMTVPASTSYLKIVRGGVRTWLETIGAERRDWDVVVTELVTNAIQATDGVRSSVSLRMFTAQPPVPSVDDETRVMCEVSNVGEWEIPFSLPVALDYLVARMTSPRLEVPSGRGLRMVTAFTSGGQVDIVDGSTIVTVWLDQPID